MKMPTFHPPIVVSSANWLLRILAGAAMACQAVAAPNLVPTQPSTEPNYWCTWYVQNYWIGRGTDLTDLGSVNNEAAREELTEDAVFNEKDGWATTYLPRSRQDYIFLIDHGWQTKDKSERIAGGPDFFNLVLDERDFPRYAGLAPEERLKRFNEDIKALGWNSLGIWTRGNITQDQARTFVEWSKHAGIRYWKIDGGDISKFHSFRAKQELYPELVLEYITGAGGNINPRWSQDLPSYPSVYDIDGSLQKPMLDCLRHSDVFRTYDASPLLMSATTLRRTHDILKQAQQQPDYRAVLNVQDDCNIAVGLGVLVASKRHPNMGERTYKGRDLHHQLSGPRAMQKRIDEVGRFARWSRIAPAFPAGEGTYLSSETELIDRCEFTEWDTWAQQTYGKMVSQSAPAIMARNMPLPVVETDGVLPYVCATTYPNGPTGIATEGRVRPDERWSEPRAKVTVKIKDAAQPIAIIGHYRELVLEFAGPLDGVRHVWAQDLLAEQAADILSEVRLEGDRLIVSGDLIARVGTAAATPGDLSAPGLVLQLEGERLPVAGADFAPETKPVTSIARGGSGTSEQIDGYQGSARITKDGDDYAVTANGPFETVLKKMPETLTSGKHVFTWEMAAAEDTKRNGFLIVASDPDASAALVAGSWIGSDQMALFQNRSDWTDAPTQLCRTNGPLKCRLTVDLDLRKAALEVNGKTMSIPFDESFTSISHIGFGAHYASTRFTVPSI